jgi:hypothetical protein
LYRRILTALGDAPIGKKFDTRSFESQHDAFDRTEGRFLQSFRGGLESLDAFSRYAYLTAQVIGRKAGKAPCIADLGWRERYTDPRRHVVYTYTKVVLANTIGPRHSAFIVPVRGLRHHSPATERDG